MDWQESFLIKELNTLAPNGYNLETGGNKNKHPHELTKQKIRENMPDLSGENNPIWGKHQSEKSRQRMSDNHWDSSGENNPNWGKSPSEETRQRISEKMSGENHPRARVVILISPEGIEYNLPCYRPFCKEHNLNNRNICQVLQGKRKHHKGWTGKYI